MVGSVLLSWTLTIVFGATGLWFLAGCMRIAAANAVAIIDRMSDLAHAAMCAGMIAMIWPWGRNVPVWFQAAVFGTATVWFLVLLTGDARLRPASYPSGSRGLWHAHHALMMGAMTWMVVAMPVSMSMPGAVTVISVVLAAYFVLAAIPCLSGALRRRRALDAACHAVTSVGMGGMLLAMP